MRRLHELIAHHPAADTAFIDHDGRSVGFGALRAQSIALAEALATHGVRAGDRVVLLAENCALFPVVVFALSRLDAWVTLVNARQSESEVAATVAHAGARCVVCTRHVSAEAAAHAERLGATTLLTLDVGPVVVSPVADTEVEPVDPSDRQVAALMYTTGTTSAPKGVMLSHRNLIFNTVGVAKVWGAMASDDVLCALPMTHIFGFASLMLPAIHAGARVRLHTRYNPASVLDALADGVTVFPAVPQMMSALFAHMDATGRALHAPAIRRTSTGGAPLDPDLKRRAEAEFGVALANGYGITEAAPTVSTGRPDRPREDNAVGWPLDGIELRIDQPDTDGIGEIWIRGENIMLGYYRDPERSLEALTDDGWLRSGDLGRIDDDGALFIAGRLKELIIRSGFNVYPPEVEDMLTRHPAVYQAAVVGRAVPGNEEIVAFVLTDGAVTADAIHRWLRERLVAYKLPQQLVIVDGFPTAATGKILKHTLLGTFADRLADGEGAATASAE
ncbi:MAG: AMP-binding protein [Pseudomonadota bacterium]